jgi:3-oxoacyl-ACP reductase-like protein
MSIFTAIKEKIFGVSPAAAAPKPAAAPVAAAPAAPTAPAAPKVSLEVVLADMASKAGQKLNYESSIVDLMKLVGIDSSLANRKELAVELGYKGDMNDSASMNIWLHKATMDRLRAAL